MHMAQVLKRLETQEHPKEACGMHRHNVQGSPGIEMVGNPKTSKKKVV
jgi:hypothetical protein